MTQQWEVLLGTLPGIQTWTQLQVESSLYHNSLTRVAGPSQSFRSCQQLRIKRRPSATKDKLLFVQGSGGIKWSISPRI